MSKLQVTYRQNPDYDEESPGVPRLFASIDLQAYGAEERVTALPIYFRHLPRPVGPVRQVYSTCVAGLPVEKGNLNSLEKTLDLYFRALVHFGRLPAYVFQVAGRAWPIYRLPDQLVTRYPGCPVFSAPTIGELRLALADTFKASGRIRNRKELGMLHLSRHDLALYLPICMLRAPGRADVPVFSVRTETGTALTAPVNAAAVTVPATGAGGMLTLHEAAAAYLMQRGKLTRPGQLTVRKLTPPVWNEMQHDLRPLDKGLTYYDRVSERLVRRHVPVFANGKVLVAARTNRLAHTALHLGLDIRTLQSGLGHELFHEGKLSSPEYVTINRSG